MKKLHPFQQTGVEFLRSTPRSILADDPGLGKTVQTLTALDGRTLVVSPARLIGQWRDEVVRWRPDLIESVDNVSYASLNERDGRKMSNKAKRELLKGGYDRIVFDESHALKGRSSKRTKAAKQLCRSVDEVWMLTGTPIPNWAHEIFQPLQLLHPGDFPSYWRWVDEWFRTWKPPWGGTEITGLHEWHTWDDFAKGNQLDRLMLRRERDTVLTDLPPLTEQTITVPMEPAQGKMYRELAAQYVTWAEDGHEVSAFTDGAQFARLAQLATGAEIVGAPPSSGKLSMLEELMEERRHSPTVIFCHYRLTADEIGRRLEAMGIAHRVVKGGDSVGYVEETRELFQAGKLPALVGTLGVISEGLTLHAADTAIMVERSWRPSVIEQAKRRIHRMGQERPCTMITLITSGTVDEGMTRLLDAKTDQMIKALSAAEFARLLRG